MKRKKNKNPLLQKKFEEGYELGLEHGVQKATAFFIERFESLKDVKGIGDKTLEKVKKQLFKGYLK